MEAILSFFDQTLMLAAVYETMWTLLVGMVAGIVTGFIFFRPHAQSNNSEVVSLFLKI